MPDVTDVCDAIRTVAASCRHVAVRRRRDGTPLHPRPVSVPTGAIASHQFASLHSSSHRFTALPNRAQLFPTMHSHVVLRGNSWHQLAPINANPAGPAPGGSGLGAGRRGQCQTISSILGTCRALWAHETGGTCSPDRPIPTGAQGALSVMRGLPCGESGVTYSKTNSEDSEDRGAHRCPRRPTALPTCDLMSSQQRSASRPEPSADGGRMESDLLSSSGDALFATEAKMSMLGPAQASTPAPNRATPEKAHAAAPRDRRGHRMCCNQSRQARPPTRRVTERPTQLRRSGAYQPNRRPTTKSKVPPFRGFRYPQVSRGLVIV